MCSFVLIAIQDPPNSMNWLLKNSYRERIGDLNNNLSLTHFCFFLSWLFSIKTRTDYTGFLRLPLFWILSQDKNVTNCLRMRVLMVSFQNFSFLEPAHSQNKNSCSTTAGMANFWLHYKTLDMFVYFLCLTLCVIVCSFHNSLILVDFYLLEVLQIVWSSYNEFISYFSLILHSNVSGCILNLFEFQYFFSTFFSCSYSLRKWNFSYHRN